jgi:hypothetical protein
LLKTLKDIIRRIAESISRFTDVALGLGDIRKTLSILRIQQSQMLLDGLLAQPRSQDPLRLLRYGYKIFSQSDEDGIIDEIFARIGTESRFFIEIGAGIGWENNTCALLYKGWRGVWVEAGHSNIATIRRGFSEPLSTGRLRLMDNFVTREFGAEALKEWPSLNGVDLFSLDIDGNDLHVLAAFEEIKARLIIVEYNAKFRPPIEWVMPYDPTYVWDGTDLSGASLSAWCELLERKNYSLVGCNISGVNAFFVRNDLIGDKFKAPYSAENHYETARYWLGAFFSGHRSKA